ncbi:hypothetical protein L3Q67_45225 (plasmid) [Saccharothrix sp. AJ9571]|nr:hypothetical protein L3Q67_45225 [Saccharothrix sp. AJ9571]
MPAPETTAVTAAVNTFCSSLVDISGDGWTAELEQLGRRDLARTMAEVDRLRSRLVVLLETTYTAAEQHLAPDTLADLAHALVAFSFAGERIYIAVAELDPGVAAGMPAEQGT